MIEFGNTSYFMSFQFTWQFEEQQYCSLCSFSNLQIWMHSRNMFPERLLSQRLEGGLKIFKNLAPPFRRTYLALITYVFILHLTIWYDMYKLWLHLYTFVLFLPNKLVTVFIGAGLGQQALNRRLMFVFFSNILDHSICLQSGTYSSRLTTTRTPF